MSNLDTQGTRKEKLLQRLASLSPRARMAVLKAALELKQERKLKDDPSITVDLTPMPKNTL